MNQQQLGVLLTQLADLEARKKKLAEQTTETNKQIQSLTGEVTQAMVDMALDAGLDDPSAFSVDLDGRRYRLRQVQHYTIKAAERQQAFAALRKLGLGDLIVERVDDRSLTKALTEYEDEAGDLPDSFSILPVQAYTETKISNIKIPGRK